MTGCRLDRYRQLSAPLGQQQARALIDRLQVLALTQPETLREIEAFIDRGSVPAQRFPLYPNPDQRREPDRRKESLILDDPRLDRRRATRRLSEKSRLRARG
jgi:hypothetical protein